MRRTILGLIVALFLAGVCHAGGYELRGQAGDSSVTLTFDKNEPSIGKNQIRLEIRDGAQRLVRNGLIQIDYFMPSLPGRPPMMTYKTSALPVNGVYKATLDLTMRGLWRLILVIKTERKSEELNLEFEVK